MWWAAGPAGALGLGPLMGPMSPACLGSSRSQRHLRSRTDPAHSPPGTSSPAGAQPLYKAVTKEQEHGVWAL